MKLHLPKLLRNSVLACIAAVASVATTTVGTATLVGSAMMLAQQASAVTVTGSGDMVDVSFSASSAYGGVAFSYLVDKTAFGQMVGLNAANVTVGFDYLATKATEDSGTPLIYITNASGYTWGLHLTNTADSQVMNGYWLDNKWDNVHKKLSSITTDDEARLKAVIGTSGTYLYPDGSETAVYSASGLCSSNTGNVSKVTINSNHISTIYTQDYANATVTNADGTYSQEFEAPKLVNLTSGKTVINGGVSTYEKGQPSSTLKGTGKTILVGGAGQLQLQAWNTDAGVDLDNDIILASSTFAGLYEGASSYGVMRISNDSYDSTLSGSVTLIEDSSMTSSGSKAINFTGAVTGGYALSVGGGGYNFTGAVDVATLRLGQGCWGGSPTAGNITFGGTVDVNSISIDTNTTVTFAAGSSLTLNGTVKNAGAAVLNGNLVVDLGNPLQYEMLDVNYVKTSNGTEAAANGYANIGKVLLIGGNVTSNVTGVSGQHVNGAVVEEGVGLVGNVSYADRRYFYVNEGKVTWGTDGYTDGADTTRTYVVAGGAELDTNGNTFGYSSIILGEGAVLSNTGNRFGTTTRQIHNLTLEGDAAVNMVNSQGLLAHEWGETTLALNDHVMTKKGSGTFFMINTAVASGGSINIHEGVVQIGRGTGTEATDASEVDFILTGGELSLFGQNVTLTTNSLNGNGSITGGGNLVISGASSNTFTGTGTLQTLALAQGSSLELGTGTSLSITNMTDRSLKGNLIIGKDATLTFTGQNTRDCVNYGAAVDITIKGGKWDVGQNRVSLANNNKIVLDGGTIDGVGDTSGALDFLYAGYTLVSRGDSNLGATLKLRTGALTTQVNDGTLTISGRINQNDASRKIVKTGAGKLQFTCADATLGNGLEVSAGSVLIRGAADDATSSLTLGGTTSVAGTIEIGTGGNLVFANDATVNITDTSALEKVAGGTFTDAAGKAGDNGFYSGKVYVIKGGFTTGETFAVQMNGTATDAYTKDTNGLTIEVDDDSTYFINKGRVTTGGTDNLAEDVADAFYVGSDGVLVFADQRAGAVAKVVKGTGRVEVSFGTNNHDNSAQLGDAFYGTVAVNGYMNLSAFTLGNSAVVELVSGQHWSSGGTFAHDIKLSDTQGNYVFRNSWDFTLAGKVTGQYLDVGTAGSDGGTLVLSSALNDIKHVHVGSGGNAAKLKLTASHAFDTIDTTGNANSHLELASGAGLSLGNGTAECVSNIHKLVATAGGSRITLRDKAVLNAIGSVTGGTATIGGQGTYVLAEGSIALADNLKLAGDWAGTVKATNVSVTSAVDATDLTTLDSKLHISGLTVADGAALTLGGSVTLGGTLTLAETVVTNGSLAFADDVMLDLTGLVGTEVDGSTVYQVFSAGDLSNLSADNLSGDFKNAAGDGVWEFGTDGTITLVAGLPANILAVPSTGLAYDSATITDVMDTILLEAGELTLGDTDVSAKFTTLQTQGGGSIIGTGTENQVSFGTITVAPGDTLTIKDGATDLTISTAALNLGSNSKIAVGANQTLDLSDLVVNTSLFNALTSAVSGSGTVQIGTGQVMLDSNETLDINTVVDGSLLRVNANNASDSYLELKKALSFSGTDSVLRLESTAKLKVSAGGALDVDSIELGHTEHGNNNGHLEIADADASVTTGGIVISSGAGGGSVTMSAGTLEITGESGIQSGIATTITGGTLKTGDNSWGITDGRVGGVSIVNSTVGDDDHTGTGTITLTNATLTGTINTDSGKLALSGTVVLDDTNGAFQTQSTNTRYSDDTDEVKGNGFRIVDKVYQVVTDATADHLDVSGITGSWMVGTTAGTYADGNVTIAGVSTDQTYWIGNGELTYSAIKNATNGEDEAITTIALYQNGEATGSLVLDETATGIGIEAKTDTTLKILDADLDDDTKVVLNRGQVTVDSGKTVTLTGNAIYDLGANYTKDAGVDLSATDWTGTVKVTNIGSSSVNQELFSIFNALGNEKSVVSVAGAVFGHLDTLDTGTKLYLETNLKLESGSVISIQNGNSYTADDTKRVSKFGGKVEGDGNIELTYSKYNNTACFNIQFAGDVSKWSGNFVNKSSKATTAEVDFVGAATTINSNVVNDSTKNANSKLYLTFGDEETAAYTMNGVVDVDLLTVAQDTTFNNSVTAATFVNNAKSTLAASHEEEAADGSVTTVTNTFTIGTLTNTGTLTANGALSVTGAVTNSGTLNLTQETAAFASLAGIDGKEGTISAANTALTVNGNATAAAIEAKSLVLNGATNSVGAITSTTAALSGTTTATRLALTGGLTLGTSSTVGKLTADTLTLSGDVLTLNTEAATLTGKITVNKLADTVLTLNTGLSYTTDATDMTKQLDFAIAESELQAYMLDLTTKSFTLADIAGIGDYTLMLNGAKEYATTDGLYTYEFVVVGSKVSLLRSVNGQTWDATCSDENHVHYFSDAGSWSSGEIPDEDTTLQFDGTGCTTVYFGKQDDLADVPLVNEVINIKNLIFEDSEMTQVGTYTFTSAEGSDWNQLHIKQNLTVNDGKLIVGSAVNIYSEGFTGVGADGELEIAQNAFVRSEAGIDVAGKVVIDARTTGGTTTNSGKLYVMNGGDVNIHAGATITIGGNDGAAGGVLAAVANDAMLDDAVDTYEYDDLAYNSNDEAGKGSDIHNAGAITSTGQIVASGDMFNSGSVTQTSGELFVYGNMTNTGADITVAEGEEKPAGMDISGGNVKVGTLTNSDTILLSGAGTKMEVTGIKHIDGDEDPETLSVTFETTYDPAALTNSGVISITGGAALEVLETQDSTTSYSLSDGSSTVTQGEYVEGRLVNEEGGVINIGSAAEGETPATSGSLTVNGDLTNRGSIDMVQGTIDVTGDLDNTGGTLTIAGGDLGKDAEGNSIYNLTVGGDLLNTDGTVSISGEGTKAHVGGDLTLNPAGTDTPGSTLTVGDATSLEVEGDLSAKDMTLGFDGIVTVGGTATVENLTSEEKAAFIAENAAIAGTLANDGSLTVTTTLVTDEDGNAVLDEEGNKQYTGGQLSIGTLMGGGEVHVQEGGALSIGSSVDFTGVLDNKGSMVFGSEANPDAVVTLNNTQTAGQTAGDMTAASIKVTANATGAEVDGKETSYMMGNVVTDTLTISELTAASPRVTMDSLSSRAVVDETTGYVQHNSVKLVLTDIEDTANTSLEAGTEYHALKTAIDANSWVGFDLTNYGIVSAYTPMPEEGMVSQDSLTVGGDGIMYAYHSGAAGVASDYMQALLKAGKRVFVSIEGGAAAIADGDATSLVDVDVKVTIDDLLDSENVWNVGNVTTDSGLIVLKRQENGSYRLDGNDILDNVKKIIVGKGQKNIVMTDSEESIAAGTDLNKVTLNGLTDTDESSLLYISGDGSDKDTVNITTAEEGFKKGQIGLNGVSATVKGIVNVLWLYDDTVADVTLRDSNVAVYGTSAEAPAATLAGSMTGGALHITENGSVSADSTLNITGTDLNIAFDDKGATTMDTTEVSETGQVLVDLGNMTGTAGDIVIGKDGKNSALLEKYFTNIRFDGTEGAVVADRNDSYFSDNFEVESANGEAGIVLADAALLKLNPQMNRDSALGAMLTAIEGAETSTERDELAAALAGAGNAVLGMAVSGDVDRQLRAIRNRTTTMGVDQSVANEDMPYFNAWINAEGSMNELSDNGTEGGYKLNSWGGTVGFDVDVCPTFTAGMAFTAMYGDLDVTGADQATGDLDTYYLSAFARYSESAWTHTFVATVGMGDISLERTVMGSKLESETDALSFGLMYEVGRVFSLDEDGSACLQPVFNVTWKHTTVDGYTEKGSDLALKVDEQTVDTVTFGLGARLQAVVGESMYNRTSIFEARVLAKADVGDRNGSADVALAGLSGHQAEVESAEMGAFGLEAGAGLTIPVGEEGGSIFMDASVELRSDYTDVNGTVGYRINF